MIEVRFHGRGGQGAVLASVLLAEAAFRDGKVPQSFPFFGVERRGAPVTAYARVDDRPIGLRTSITAPDVVVVLDPGLLRTVPVADGLKPEGLLLANSRLPPESLKVPVSVRVATVDAAMIARAHHLGSPTMPIVNTAMLGALARVTGIVAPEALNRAIDAFVPRQPLDNRAAASDGYRMVRTAPRTMGTENAIAPPLIRPSLALPEGPVATVPSRTLHTASWRTLTPQIHFDRCTKCDFCWKFCPDNAIGFDDAGYPVIHLEFCKGCGICAEECPPKTIEMIAEG
ncbi:MAG: 2-oxoacid:acceptor oxidoreductase family protein [Thermoplasmata archaeon]